MGIIFQSRDSVSRHFHALKPETKKRNLQNGQNKNQEQATENTWLSEHSGLLKP